MRTKKAAMEMSVGTIVTVVLLMTVLILGLVMVRTIFKSQTDNINAIDDSVKSEIAKLFSEDDSKKVVAYPASGQVKIRKGTEGTGFGLSIRNRGLREGAYFGYDITSKDGNLGGNDCDLSEEQTIDLIRLGKTESGVWIDDGTLMDSPFKIFLNVPESFPLCNIRYTIKVFHAPTEEATSGAPYETVFMDLQITSE